MKATKSQAVDSEDPLLSLEGHVQEKNTQQNKL